MRKKYFDFFGLKRDLKHPESIAEKNENTLLRQKLEAANLHLTKLKLDNNDLQQSNLKYKKENDSLKIQLHQQKAKGEKLKTLSTKHSKKDKEQIVRNTLSPFFSDTMISCFLRGKWNVVRNWSKEDIQLALTLRLLSKKTYQLLRKKKLLPLPGLSTLRKYFREFQIPEGYLDSVGHLLKLKAKTLAPRDRIVCLNFDEVYLKRDISWQQLFDKIIGPHRAANVMILRGLCKKFKLPIWYKFDYQMTPEELFNIIKCVEEAGFHVVAVTSDMGPSNQGLAKKLGITLTNTSFINPTRPDTPIFWFYDIVHLVKLIRNHLLDSGFKLPSGTVIDKAKLRKVMNHFDGDISMSPKLKHALLDIKHQDRQRVRPAAQLLSKSMADAIEHLFPNDAKMQELAEFLKIVDNWFDVFNSSSKYPAKSHKKLRCAYGVHLDEQRSILNTFIETVDSLTVCGKKSHMAWQKGVIISSNSLMALYDTLKEQYDIEYIMTCRLNQDALESMFGVLRAMEGIASQFGALSFMNRLRNYLLGAGGDIIIQGANVESTEHDEKVLTSDMTRGILKSSDLELPQNTQISSNADDNLDIESILESYEDIEAEIADELDEEEEDIEVEDRFGSKTKDEALKYIAGYLPRKSASNDLALTSAEMSDQEKFVESKWIDLRNVGGLLYPTKDFHKDVIVMEKVFVKYHSDAPDGISREAGVTKNVISILEKKFPQYDVKILKRFVLARTIRRMKFIQDGLKKQLETARSKKKELTTNTN